MLRIYQYIKRLSAVLLVVSVAVCAKAQNEAQFTQYFQLPTYYNPAAVGDTDYIRIRGGARLQWLGIQNAPRDFVAAADMPLKFLNQRWGVGVVMRQETAGLYSSLDLGAQIGWKMRRLGGEWTVAVQVGMVDRGFKGSEVSLPDDDDYHQSTDDAIPTQDVHGMAFDLGVGVCYVHKYFWAGASLMNALSPTVKMDVESASGGSETSSDRKYEFRADRTVNFMAGSNIPIKNTLFEIAPSVLFKTDFTFWTAEATVRALYNKLLWFGVGYRWDDAVYATVGVEFKNIYAGYSYDYATSAIHSASSGSHEIVVGYRMKLNLGDKNRNRHKSIRIM